MRAHLILFLTAWLLTVAACTGSAPDGAREETQSEGPVSRLLATSSQSLSLQTVAMSASHADVQVTLFDELGAMRMASVRVDQSTGLVEGELVLDLSDDLETMLLDHLDTLAVGTERVVIEAILSSQLEDTQLTLKRSRKPACDLGCRLLTCLSSCERRSNTAYCDAWCNCMVIEGKGNMQCHREVHIIDL